jgi:uncharacterized protein (TIGR03067 family)
MNKAITAFCLASLVTGLGRANANENPANSTPASAQLVGFYTIVAGQKFGLVEPQERIQGTTVAFTEDTITVTDKNKKQAYVATYSLHAEKKPWEIAMTSTLTATKGQTALGLIEKDEDAVKLIYSLPGSDRPTGFSTNAKQLMFILKPLKK